LRLYAAQDLIVFSDQQGLLEELLIVGFLAADRERHLSRLLKQQQIMFVAAC
jgi:hypothetical protein